MCKHPLGDEVELAVAEWAGDVQIKHVHDQLWPTADQSLAEHTHTQSLSVVVQVCLYACIFFEDAWAWFCRRWML